jgi:hypothetical protein
VDFISLDIDALDYVVLRGGARRAAMRFVRLRLTGLIVSGKLALATLISMRLNRRYSDEGRRRKRKITRRDGLTNLGGVCRDYVLR